MIPDLHHYKGSFGGRAFPLWRDSDAQNSNIAVGVLEVLRKIKTDVSGDDVLAYIAAVAAHPAYTARFKSDLFQPGLRIPLTAEASLFAEAVALGKEVIWLHTFGERFADPAAGRPAASPKMASGDAPKVPKGGGIPSDPEKMPDDMIYDATTATLHVGEGKIEGVTQAMWEYEVSGKHVLLHWFSYRKKNRERPIIGDRRPPSPLGNIQPEGWLAEYTTELLQVLNVIGRLIELEPKQESLLKRICKGKTIPASKIPKPAAAAKLPGKAKKSKDVKGQMELL